MTQNSGVPAGWYPDPAHGIGMRWWDGVAWTEHVSPPPPPAYAAHPATTPAALPGYATTTAALPGYATTPAGYPAQLAYAGSVGYAGPPATRDRSLEWLIPVGRTGLSIAAGYAGLVALLCFYTAPIALILGVFALRGLRGSPLGGRGRAWFGAIVGGLGTALILVLVVLSIGR
jgi:hypothetical protein